MVLWKDGRPAVMLRASNPKRVPTEHQAGREETRVRGRARIPGRSALSHPECFTRESAASPWQRVTQTPTIEHNVAIQIATIQSNVLNMILPGR